MRKKPPSSWPLIPKSGRLVYKCLVRLFPILYCFQKQDHYAVLGLSHLRYKATADQIKIAREFVLFDILHFERLISIRPQEGFEASPR